MRTIEEIQADINETSKRLTELEQEKEGLLLSTCPIKVGMIVKRTAEWRRSLADTPYLVTELRSMSGQERAFVYGRKGKKGGGFELRSVFIAPSDEVAVVQEKM